MDGELLIVNCNQQLQQQQQQHRAMSYNLMLAFWLPNQQPINKIWMMMLRLMNHIHTNTHTKCNGKESLVKFTFKYNRERFCKFPLECALFTILLGLNVIFKLQIDCIKTTKRKLVAYTNKNYVNFQQTLLTFFETFFLDNKDYHRSHTKYFSAPFWSRIKQTNKQTNKANLDACNQ